MIYTEYPQRANTFATVIKKHLICNVSEIFTNKLEDQSKQIQYSLSLNYRLKQCGTVEITLIERESGP